MGLDGSTIIAKINEGFGKTLSNIGIIIAFGSIIGAFLEKSGGTAAIANYLLRLIGEKKSPLAMNLTGLLVSIPVFCDSAFIILASLNKALSKKTGISIVVFAVALSTGLYVSHVFIPPTPEPLAAAAALKADLGLVILMGIALAIPTAFAGYLWAKISGSKLEIKEVESKKSDAIVESKKGMLAVFFPILIPILLIALRSVADYPSFPFGQGLLYKACSFFGNPLVALFIGILFAMQLVDKGITIKSRLGWVTNALKEAGVIILITGAGGALNQLHRIDFSELDHRLAKCEIIAACDVSNPLTGINGASLVFGGQKGGNSKELKQLDKSLLHYTLIIQSDVGVEVNAIAGAGAAGGMGAAMAAFFNAKLMRGIDLIINLLQLEKHIQQADLVITGEGKIDTQTLYGKVVMGVAGIAKKNQVPVIAIAGKVEDEMEEIYTLGVSSVFSIVNKPMDLSEALGNAGRLIVSCTENIMRIVKIK